MAVIPITAALPWLPSPLPRYYRTIFWICSRSRGYYRGNRGITAVAVTVSFSTEQSGTGHWPVDSGAVLFVVVQQSWLVTRAASTVVNRRPIYYIWWLPVIASIDPVLFVIDRRVASMSTWTTSQNICNVWQPPGHCLGLCSIEMK